MVSEEESMEMIKLIEWLKEVTKHIRRLYQVQYFDSNLHFMTVNEEPKLQFKERDFREIVNAIERFEEPVAITRKEIDQDLDFYYLESFEYLGVTISTLYRKDVE